MLSEAVEGRDNNLNLLRFLAASGVLVSHAYPIALGTNTSQPLEATLGVTLGHLCVLVFFAISGLLITQSRQRSSSIARWTAARVLRIMPGLLVVLVLTVGILGPLVTTLTIPDYATASQTLAYLPRNLSLYFMQYDLPGVFDGLPYPEAINGSLWTLNYEVTCYIGVALLAALGGLRGGAWGIVLLCGALIGATAVDALRPQFDIPTRLASLAYLAMPFIIGALLYLIRAQVPLQLWIVTALAAFAWLTHGTALAQLSFAVALSYGVFWLAYVPGGFVRAFNRIGDYSYGIYIYAFPVQQTVAWAMPDQTPLTNMTLAFPITLIFAIASWHLVEKPCLALKSRLGRRSDRRLAAHRL